MFRTEIGLLKLKDLPNKSVVKQQKSMSGLEAPTDRQTIYS